MANETKHPRYRISQWIDTSEEAMDQPQATILYGVQAQTEKGGKWMHCHAGGKALIFKTPNEASAAIAAATPTP
jgi:hypothetical protein